PDVLGLKVSPFVLSDLACSASCARQIFPNPITCDLFQPGCTSWDADKQEKRVYPWGNTFIGSLLNFCDKNCSFDRADKSVDDGYAETSPVGHYPDGASFYGLLDMAGNVWEWVADWYDAYPGNTVSNDSYGTTYRVMRGGSWYYNEYFVRSAFRGRGGPSNSGDLVGFRCARSLP
ncbi:MAG: SUMF1/EgtB/PvdO family nonheme iron enzyme, partial [Chloroflexota bacterium]